MAKPMLVTLPCVLLLLDYWPLKRLRRQAPDMGKQATTVSPRGQNVTVTGPTRQATIFNWRVLWEKLPLLALTAISCRLTVWPRPMSMLSRSWRYSGGRAMPRFPQSCIWGNCSTRPIWRPSIRIRPSAVPPWRPWRQFPRQSQYWPENAAILSSAGYGIWAGRAVCGLLQVGTQGHADRYTYLPQIGLCIAIAWAVAELTKNWCWQKLICGSASAIVIAALMWCAWRQTGDPCDSETLWRHAIDCIPSDFAYNNLVAVGEAGKTDEAIETP